MCHRTHSSSRIAAAFAAVSLLVQMKCVAHADALERTQSTPPSKVRIHASLRAYQFNRSYRAGTPYQQAQNNALHLHAEYGDTSHGFSVGATYFNANPLHSQAYSPDSTLPATQISALGEAYVQYSRHNVRFRFGRQIVDTPFANASDTRLIPATFYGFTAGAQVSPNLRFDVARLGQWKSRVASGFASNDLLTLHTTPGQLISGLTFAHSGVGAALWQYQFYDVAHLTYAELSDAQGTSSAHVRGAVQYLTEGSLGQHFAGTIESHVYGASVAMTRRSLEVSAAYDVSPYIRGAFHDGGLASPYAYTRDPIYTTAIVSGLFNSGAGSSYKLVAAYSAPNGRAKATVSEGRYFSASRSAAPTTCETDMDFEYALTQKLRLRNRTAILNMTLQPFASTYNRLQVEYDL